jgi:hypothetical protein
LRTITCQHCGKALSETQKEWDHAWETGTCPACGRFFDSAAEAGAQLSAQDPGIVDRTRKARSAMVGAGVVLLVAAVILARLHLPLGFYALPVIIGVPLVARGLLHSRRAQARRELMRRTDLSSFEKP